MSWHGRDALVIGAAGFLGAHLALALHARGARVTGVVSPRTTPARLRQLGLADRMTAIAGDITDPAFVGHALDRPIDACFLAAGVATVPAVAHDPVRSFEVNVAATWRILDPLRARTPRPVVVLASSDKVYGDFGDTPLTEDAALRPSAAYEVSKACGDLIVRSWATQYGVPAAVARIGNLYGPGDLAERLVPTTVRRLLAGEPPILVRGSEDYVRELTYVADAADAMILLAERGREPEVAGRPFNVGAGAHRVGDLIAAIGRVIGSALPPRIVPPRPQAIEIRAMRVDSRRIRALGWRPAYTLDTGLAATVAWHRGLIGGDRWPPLREEG